MLMLESKRINPYQEYALKFGSFEFFDSYVISTIIEGIDMDAGKLLELYSLYFEVFQDRPFSVVEHRVSSYSMDPSFYIKYRDLLSNIRAYGVVIDPDSSVKFSEYEILYIKHCPCRVFDSTSEAVSWVHSV